MDLISKIDDKWLHDTSAIHSIAADTSSYVVQFGNPSSKYNTSVDIGLPTDINNMLINLTPNLLLKDTSNIDVSVYSKVEVDALLEEKIDTPYKAGTIGQVLTIADDGSTIIWKTPEVGGYEYVTVALTTYDGLGDVSGLQLDIEVEGEATHRYLTTDETGTCIFAVKYGLLYTVNFPPLSGYQSIASVSYRASLSSRRINKIYLVDSAANNEHVIIDIVYSGEGTPTTKATYLNVTIGSTTTSYTITNDRCEFDVSLMTSGVATTYTISYPSVTGYLAPSNVTLTASLHNRGFRSYYIGAVSGLYWIKDIDSSIVAIPFNEVTSDRTDLVGLLITTSQLSTYNCQYVIPIEYLLNEVSIGTKQWCQSGIEFASIPCYTSYTAASANDPVALSGESNTVNVIQEASTLSLSVPAFTSCRNLTYTVGGVEKHCFLGSIAQMKAFANNRDGGSGINELCERVFGKSCVSINSGYWWSSTQYSQTYAWFLTYGSPYRTITKIAGYQVLPFFAL